MSLIERIEYWENCFAYYLEQHELNVRSMDSEAAVKADHYTKKAAQCAAILTALRASDGEAGE